MATIRIRTHDPESVSFFTSKLADCGFDVEFATPGQRVRGEVDLELTVNYTKRSSRKQLRDGTSKTTARMEWTTPYHADAPELEDEITRSSHQNSADDRQLARILAGSSNRKNMFVIDVREANETEAEPQAKEPTPLAPRPAPIGIKPAPPSKPAIGPVRETRRPGRAKSIRPSFLQRNAAIATAIILTVSLVLLYMSLFIKPVTGKNVAQRTSAASSSTTLTPVSAPAQLVTGATAASVAGDHGSAQQKQAKPSPHNRRARPQPRSRVVDTVAESDEPEVIIRHFPPKR